MSHPSNDLLADRRFAWAEAMAADGDDAAAADILDQVVERVPHWTPAWAALGTARNRLGHRDAAMRAWRQAASLDPDGQFGAALHLARLGCQTPSAMPAAYVRELFEAYAPRFEHHLVERLGYRGPAVLIEGLDRTCGERRFDRALDLGCGTGLMGRALARRAERIDGIDLSCAMVAQARQTGCYVELTAASVDETLEHCPEGRYDLVTAADVLVYIGDLAPVFSGTFHALAPGGLFAATLQTFTAAAEAGRTSFQLGADLRFAHAADYVEAALGKAGFRIAILEASSTRTENGVPVPGLLAVAQRA